MKGEMAVSDSFTETLRKELDGVNSMLDLARPILLALTITLTVIVTLTRTRTLTRTLALPTTIIYLTLPQRSSLSACRKGEVDSCSLSLI